MKARATLVLAVALVLPSLSLASPTVPATSADLAGSWSLAPLQEDQAPSGPGTITLVLNLQQGKLAGVAVVPLPSGETRWPLVDPTFDGKTFSFKVDNGETLLAGEMKLVDGKFEGRWASEGEGKTAGRLTMKRKAE